MTDERRFLSPLRGLPLSATTIPGAGAPGYLLAPHPGLNQRPAATLVEVLVAIFVMAIGLLALLALFPLGVIRMAQAIQDGRTSQVAANAEEILLFKGWRYDAQFQSIFCEDRNPANPMSLFPVDLDGPSYPVLVDPLGYISASAVGNIWVGNDASTLGWTNLKRDTVAYINNQPAGSQFSTARQWFTLLDDLTFNIDGTAGTGANVEREINYSWAYLMQRPRAGDPTVVNSSVIVFKNRSLSLSGDLTLSESYYGPSSTNGAVYFVPSNNTVVFDYSAAGQVPPPLRAGDWILDSTPVLTRNDPNPMNQGQRVLADLATAQYRTAHGAFYRVVGVTELSDTQTEVEVETPLRGFPADTYAATVINGENGYSGTAIIIENVVEVFDKGTGWRP